MKKEIKILISSIHLFHADVCCRYTLPSIFRLSRARSSPSDSRFIHSGNFVFYTFTRTHRHFVGINRIGASVFVCVCTIHHTIKCHTHQHQIRRECVCCVCVCIVSFRRYDIDDDDDDATRPKSEYRIMKNEIKCEESERGIVC